jgi:hypothetical protein
LTSARVWQDEPVNPAFDPHPWNLDDDGDGELAVLHDINDTKLSIFDGEN